MADELSARQLALLYALRAAEVAPGPADLDAIAGASGYSVSSVRTYFSKRLLGVLVTRDEDGAWWVKGALKCSEAAFARRMSQKAGTAAEALATEETWRELVRKLLFEGVRRGYTLSVEERALLGELDGGDGPADRQPSLFDPVDPEGS